MDSDDPNLDAGRLHFRTNDWGMDLMGHTIHTKLMMENEAQMKAYQK